MTTEKSRFLTIKEFALQLKVHQVTVQRWIKGGQLAALKWGEGRKSRYRISELEAAAFLDRLTVNEHKTADQTRRKEARRRR